MSDYFSKYRYFIKSTCREQNLHREQRTASSDPGPGGLSSSPSCPQAGPWSPCRGQRPSEPDGVSLWRAMEEDAPGQTATVLWAKRPNSSGRANTRVRVHERPTAPNAVEGTPAETFIPMYFLPCLSHIHTFMFSLVTETVCVSFWP